MSIARQLWPIAYFVTLTHSQQSSAQESSVHKLSGQDPTLNSSAGSVAVTGLTVEAGSKEQRLTGRIAGSIVDGVAMDLSLSGANTNKSTNTSDLIHTLSKPAGGEVALGIIYDTFDFDNEFEAAWRYWCGEQNKANGIDDLDSKINQAQDKLTDAKRQLGDAEEKFLATSQQSAAVESAASAYYHLEHKRIEVEKAEQELKRAKDSRVDIDIKLAEAAVKKAKQELETAEATFVSASQKPGAMGALDAAHYQLEAHRAFVAKAELDLKAAKDARSNGPKECLGPEMLEAGRKRQLPSPKASYLFFARGSFGSRSIDFFDPATGNIGKEAAHPLGLVLGAGAFLLPTLYIGASLRYSKDKSVGDAGSICRDQQVAGATTMPATYICSQDVTIGTPKWRQASTIRLELRQYLTAKIGWNPSLSYAYSDTNEDFPIFRHPGAWSFQVPVYIRISSKSPLTFGLNMIHTETFGLGAKNTKSTDAIAFLSATFDLISVHK
jgi:hypothetical protein